MYPGDHFARVLPLLLHRSRSGGAVGHRGAARGKEGEQGRGRGDHPAVHTELGGEEADLLGVGGSARGQAGEYKTKTSETRHFLQP